MTMKFNWNTPDGTVQGMSPETVDANFRAMRAQVDAPFFFGRNVLRAAAKAGLDVERLKADGIIAETQRIPTK